MKKSAIFALLAIFILCAFTACGQPKVDGGELVTNFAGEEYAVATEADGSVKRNENGDVIILATDENGKSYTDENGEKATVPVNSDRAIVIGNLIEFDRYYIELPDGWSNNNSYRDMIFKKDGTNDQIVVIERKGVSMAEPQNEYREAREQIKSSYPDAVTADTTFTIDDETNPFYSVFVPEGSTSNGNAVYYAETYHTVGDYIYTVRISSDRDLSDSTDEIFGIISTIKFK